VKLHHIDNNIINEYDQSKFTPLSAILFIHATT
jgi:hypothetical protein